MVFSPDTLGWIIKSFKPVIYALIVAYMLDSLVMVFMRKLKVNRIQGIFLVCVLVIGIISFSIYKVLPKIAESVNNIMAFVVNKDVDISEILINIRNKIDNQYVHVLTNYILEASEYLRSIINKLLIQLSNILMSIISNIGSSAITIISSFIINIYMLSEKEDLLARGRRFIHAYFDEKEAGHILLIFSKANKIFKSFLNGKLLDSTIVGILCILAFIVAKVPYATLFGAIIGFFNVIPYFGPVIGSIPVVVVSFFIDPPKALTALIIIIIVQQIDANILDPRIVGGNVGVTPFWIIVSVTVGGNMFGIAGMLLGVPIVVLLKTIIEESIEMRLIVKGKENIEKNKLRK